MNRCVRGFFSSRGYLEVDTPMLCAQPVPESHIELFSTLFSEPQKEHKQLYLVPSPEVWLKLLLAHGAPSLFQIGKSFRNGEQFDEWHRPEFTMLEWYTLEASADDNIAIMELLLNACRECITGNVEHESLRVMSMEEAFRNFAGFSLAEDLKTAGFGPDIKADEMAKMEQNLAKILRQRLKTQGMFRPENDGDEAATLFHFLFLQLVEPALPTDCPLVLNQWPAIIPTLAKTSPDNLWADRWELYIKGVEVANCFGEERQPEALRRYWKRESENKAKAEKFNQPSKEDWISQISKGMPECSGVALGMDRLLALIRGDTNLTPLDIIPIQTAFS